MIKYDVVIIGGCGHVGLPLGVKFAEKGKRVLLVDSNLEYVKKVNSAEAPFIEEGLEESLKITVLVTKLLRATSDISELKYADTCIVTIGSPTNEHFSHDNSNLKKVLLEISKFLSPGSLIILRSTLFPGTTNWARKILSKTHNGVCYCPERILQGKSLSELEELPQIIATDDNLVYEKARELFSVFAQDAIKTSPEEAEFAKLFANSYRYMTFALVNEFYSIANSAGLNFNRIHQIMTQGYPRASGLPKPGFAAGPCLMKDTVQLVSFAQNKFLLGTAAVMTNEGMAEYVISEIQKSVNLSDLTVGLLGMSFKPEIDDTRSSLSFRILKLLEIRALKVICNDPFVIDQSSLHPIEYLKNNCDILIICTPHETYKKNLLDFQKPIVDIWGFLSDNTNIQAQLNK